MRRFVRRSRLTLRGLRRRAPLTIAIWACALVVIAGAVLGAVFAQAAGESDLQDVLRAAPAGTLITLRGLVGGSEQLTPAQAMRTVDEESAGPSSAYYPERVRSMYWQVRTLTRVVWRDGACAAVQITAGRCPTRAGEAMVSTRTRAALAWKVGTQVAMRGDDGGALNVEVVGVYTPRDTAARIWAGHSYFQQEQLPDSVVTDTVFVSRPTFTRLSSQARMQAQVDWLLHDRRVRLADQTAVQAVAPGLNAWSAQHGRHFTASTTLPTVLHRAAGQRAAIDVSTTLVVLQLCVLGWLVLFQVLRDAFEGRSGDIVLAKLRGYRSIALLRFACGEPVLLLLFAAVPGTVAGWLVGRAVAGAVLLPDTPVVLPPVAFIAAGAALVGGAVAVVITGVGVLRRPVVEQWRSTRKQTSGRRRGVLAEAALVMIAVAGFVVLRLLGPDRAGPAVLMAPGLLLLAAGIGGARLLPLLLRPGVATTAFRRQLALQIAIRQVVRRPAGLRLVALLTVAVGLATFGVGGEAIAAQNRQARAAVESGAYAVQRIDVAPGGDAMQQVREADPHGRWAAAAAKWITFGGSDVLGWVLAVDVGRLPAVLNDVPGIQTSGSLGRGLVGAVEPLPVTGTRMGVTIDSSKLQGHPLEVRLELRTKAGKPVDVGAGLLRAGAHVYGASVPCSSGCEFAGIEWSRTPYAAGVVAGSAIVSAVAVDGRPIRTDLSRKQAWKAAEPLGAASDRTRSTPAGVIDQFSSDDGGTGGLAHQDLPDPVPAIVTAGTVRTSRTGALLKVAASTGDPAELRVVRRVPALPVISAQGVMVDLRSFNAALPTFGADSQWSVWLGPHAPPDARARLQRAGLVLDGQPVLLKTREAALARQGPALALLMLVLTSISGALCAVGGVTVSVGAALRRRSYEAAALTAVGVTRSQLYRAVFIEQMLLLGSAVVIGVPSGLLTVALAMPALPQGNTPTAVPQVLLPPAGPIVVITAALAIAVLAAVTLSANRVVRTATASRLREGEA